MTPRVKGLLFVFRRSGAARPSWRSHAARLSAACLLLGGASCAVTVSSGAPGDVDAGADAGDCTAQCEAKWPNEVASFRGWVACLGYSCMSQCR
jgi:hypothetical protein